MVTKSFKKLNHFLFKLQPLEIPMLGVSATIPSPWCWYHQLGIRSSNSLACRCTWLKWIAMGEHPGWYSGVWVPCFTTHLAVWICLPSPFQPSAAAMKWLWRTACSRPTWWTHDPAASWHVHLTNFGATLPTSITPLSVFLRTCYPKCIAFWSAALAGPWSWRSDKQPKHKRCMIKSLIRILLVSLVIMTTSFLPESVALSPLCIRVR